MRCDGLSCLRRYSLAYLKTQKREVELIVEESCGSLERIKLLTKTYLKAVGKEMLKTEGGFS